MDWDTLKNQWQTGGGEALDREQAAAIVAAARERSETLHRRVRGRDRLETIVALLLAPFFAVVAVIEGRQGLWITVIGCAVLVAACIYIPLKLRGARRLLPRADAASGLLAYLRGERRALEAQVKLARGVLRWYLAPIAVGVLLVFVGIQGASLASLYYALAVLGISAAIYFANLLAVARQFEPRLNEIESELQSLGEAG